MSLRILLDNKPEFYTNLDFITGRIVLSINRSEQIGNIVVKLEGESITALRVPYDYSPETRSVPPPAPPGSIVTENHKILYKIQQVFPDDYYASSSSPYGAFPLQPGEHEFPFKFKVPINNACSDQLAMSRIGGITGAGGFGMGGVRVMDGSKQLFLQHVTRTLPPSLTGYPQEAEIRYYIKVTVQRPGFLKENWRFQAGLKFLPIEPPRPKTSGQEAFARRPFAFRPRSPPAEKKQSSLFGKKSEKEGSEESQDTSTAPIVEMAARLPHPPTLTCNQSIPLRLIAKNVVATQDPVYLVSFQMDLVGTTEIRGRSIINQKQNRWVVASNPNMSIPITSEAGKEFVIPDDVWKSKTLPNTVAPSFETCNLSRRYELEVKLGLSWGKPKSSVTGKGSQPQTIYLPLHFAKVDVFSGITPPAKLVNSARTTRPGRATLDIPPQLPPRTNSNSNVPTSPSQHQSRPPQPQRPPQDPLYPPQLAPGQTVPPYDDAPPSYDEAMADNVAGPFDGMNARPAYSGVTNENAPSQMPEKS